ncbi:unnamed protein product, partial [marine sediment metagenome]
GIIFFILINLLSIDYGRVGVFIKKIVVTL